MKEKIVKIVDVCREFHQPSNLPVIFAVICTAGLATSYLLSAFLQHDVSPIFPRISHTGNFPPASMVFTFTLGMAAIFLILISHAVSRAMKAYIDNVYQKKMLSLPRNDSLDVSAIMKSELQLCKQNHSFNRLCSFCGFLTGVGILGVGAFQTANSKLLHNISLVVMVCGGYSFAILHSLNSRALLKSLMPLSQITHLFKLRVAVIIVGTVCIIGMFIFSVIGHIKREPSDNCTVEANDFGHAFQNCSNHSDYTTRGDRGFTYLATANAGQWMWVISFFVFVTTIRYELGHQIPSANEREQRTELQGGDFQLGVTNLSHVQEV